MLDTLTEVDSATGSNISGGANEGMTKLEQTNAAVSAIASMFPTVDESHIRDLLKK